MQADELPLTQPLTDYDIRGGAGAGGGFPSTYLGMGRGHGHGLVPSLVHGHGNSHESRAGRDEEEPEGVINVQREIIVT